MKKKYLYQTKLDFLDTQKAMSIISDDFFVFLKNKFNLIKLRMPIYFHELESIFDRYDFSYSRKINFDSISDYNIYKIYNNYDSWMENHLVNLKIKNNNGIFIHADYIIRDRQEKGINSFERNEILIYYVYDNSERLKEKSFEILNQFYSYFVELKQNINNKFNKLKKTLPLQIEVIDLKEKNILFNDKNVVEYKKYNLQKNKWNIFYYQKEKKDNTSSLSVFLEKLNKYIDIIKIYQKITDDITYFKIKINLDFIYMIFLEKLLIYEVQSNTNGPDIENMLLENKII